MRFLLKAGDRILVRRALLSELRPGDLAVVLDWRGGPPEYVVHRFLGRRRRAGVLCAVTKGDANLLPDPLSPEPAVVGVVEAARVAGVWRSVGPQGRVWGLALAALGAPVYRGLAAADRLCEAALRLGWTRLPLPRSTRGTLLGLLAWRERATAGAYARLQSLGARLTCGAEIAAPPDSESARSVFGILDGDQRWSGRILVEGDVFVPPGATLRVEPGTEIVFRADSQWDCLKECRIWKGWPQNLEGKCRLLIGGRLLAEATSQSPIRFGGADWAGIHFVTDSWGSSLSHVFAGGSLCAAVTLHDSAQATLKFSRFSDCEGGVSLVGRGASAALEDCRIERSLRRGLSSAGGGLTGKRVVISDCGEIGVFAQDAELELEDCAFSGSPVGLAQIGGAGRLTGVRVERASTAAFELDGGSYELRGSSATDCGKALNFAGENLRLEGFEASGCGSGIVLRAGELSWSGGRVSGGRFGLESAGASARVEDVVFQAQSIAGLRVAGGGLTLRRVSASDAGEFGVFASESELELEDCALSGSPVGLAQNGGGARLTRVRVERATKAAFELGGGAYELRGSAATDCGAALHFAGERLRLEGFEASSCGSGVVQRTGELSWSGGWIRGGRFGLESAGTRARIENVAFQAQSIAGCLMDAGGLSLREVRVSHGALGISAAGPLDAEDLGVEGCARGVEVSAGPLSWRGGFLRGGALAVFPGVAAHIAEVSFKDASGIFGVLDGDQNWSGRIQVEGDVFVPSGATLNVEPGTEIVFRADSQWECLKERLTWKDPPRVLSGRCCLLIGGKLRAEATEQEPIQFGGAPWAGIHVFGDSGESVLSHVLAGGSLCAAVTLHDAARAALKFSSFSGCESGVVLLGRDASAEIEDCRIERCRRGLSSTGGGLRARRVVVSDAEIGIFAEAAKLEFEDSRIERCRRGLSSTGGGLKARRVVVSDAEIGIFAEASELEFEDSRIERCRRGVSSAGGGLRARRLGVSDCGEIGIFAESAELELEDCALLGSPVGLGQTGKSARLTRVRVERAVKAAFELDRGEYELRDAAVTDCGSALSFGGGRLLLEGFQASGCASGVAQRAGELRWSGGRVAGGRFGLESGGERAQVENVAFQDQSIAACRMEGGILFLRGVRGLRAALGVSAGGGLDAEDLGLENCARGVEVFSGALSWRGGFLRGGGGLRIFSGVAAHMEDVTLEEGAGNPLYLEDAELWGRGLRVTGWPEGGMLALRPRRLELEACAFVRTRFGLEISGGSAVLRGLNFEDCAERALGAHSQSVVRAERVVVVGGVDGFVARGAELRVDDFGVAGHAGTAVRADDALLELRRARFDGGEAGVLAEKGRTMLDGCVLRGQAGPAVFQNGGALEIAGGAVEGLGSGVRVTAGRLRLEGMRLKGPRLSIECDGSAVLKSVALEGGAGGARFEGTSFELSGVELSGSRGVELPRGRLVWSSGRLAGGGLSIGSGAEIRLEGVAIEDVSGHGVALAGGRMVASHCRFSDMAEAGVFVTGGGAASLTDCALRRLRYGVGVVDGDTSLEDVRILEASEVGFTAESGSHRLTRVVFHGCADRVHAAGGARVELSEDLPAGRGAVAKFKRALREGVLRTRRLPLFGAAYRAVYGLPVRALQLWALLDGNASALYAHRSWTRRDWDPGLSDVDLLVAARDLSGETGRRWLERFWSRYGLLKGAFPFLGECLVAEPAELSGYAQWGGFRAREFAEQLVPLHGRLPRTQARPASAKTALEPLGELAHAYTRLMASALWRPEPSQAGRSSARNAALDVIRLRAAGAEAGPSDLAPRETALDAADSELRISFEALAAAESPPARAQLCAESLSRLHDGAYRALASWPAAGKSSLRWVYAASESSPLVAVELRRRRGLVEEYARACEGALVAGCADDLYRTYLVLDDAAVAPQSLARIFESLSRMIALRGEPATLPIVLTASSWKVWSRLAYLESPTRFLEPGAGSGDFLTSAGVPLPGAWQYAWGRERLSAVEAPDALVLDLARESRATLRCVWRWQACEGSSLSRGYIQHYLLGRAMGLRLLLGRGIGAPFFNLDLLRSLYVQEFPERAEELERLWRRLVLREGPATWTEFYAWVDAELRGD